MRPSSHVGYHPSHLLSISLYLASSRYIAEGFEGKVNSFMETDGSGDIYHRTTTWAFPKDKDNPNYS